MTDAEPVPVVYVMGAARSGTTFLNIALGNHPDVSGAGEMTNLPVRAWTRGDPCSCGAPATECSFWSAVRRAWQDETGASLAAYGALQERFTTGWRFNAVRAARRRNGAPPRGFDDFARLTASLYRSVRRVGGKPWVVDSSKSPARALALMQVPGLRLRVIHMVRDGHAVVWSFKKRLTPADKTALPRDIAPEPAWRTSWRWRRVNLAADEVMREAGAGGVRVRYEDLTAEPHGVLETVGGLLGLDFVDVADRLAAGAALDVGHVVAGGRVRMAGTVRLQPDDAWRDRLPAADRAVHRLIAGRVAGRYGYV